MNLSLWPRLYNPLTQAFAALAADVQAVLLANKTKLEIFETDCFNRAAEPRWYNAGIDSDDVVLKHWILRLNPDTDPATIVIPELPHIIETDKVKLAMFNPYCDDYKICKPLTQKEKVCLKLVTS